MPEDALIAEMEGNLCPQAESPAEVTVGAANPRKNCHTLPGRTQKNSIKRNEAYWSLSQIKIPGGGHDFDNCKIISGHLLASSTVDAMEMISSYSSTGLPSTQSVVEAIRQERIKLLAYFGLEERFSATGFFEELVDWKNHPEYSVFHLKRA